MYLYWRVQNDLDCMGEVIHFHDPGLIRCLRIWVRKNISGLAIANDHYPFTTLALSRN